MDELYQELEERLNRLEDDANAMGFELQLSEQDEMQRLYSELQGIKAKISGHVNKVARSGMTMLSLHRAAAKAEFLH